jgi:PPM family protein phosphatase
MRYQISAISDVGLVRLENEDRFLILGREDILSQGDHFEAACIGKDDFLVAVADGMGGKKAGAFASRIALEQIAAVWKRRDLETPVEVVVERALRIAHEKVFTQCEPDPELRYGATTIGLLASVGGRYCLARIGETMVTATRLKESVTIFGPLPYFWLSITRIDDSPDAPAKTVQVAAIGYLEGAVVSMASFEPQVNDSVLLLSDGVYGHLPEAEIHEILQAHPTDDLVQKFISIGLKRGGSDNLTALHCRFLEDAPHSNTAASESLAQSVRFLENITL